MVSYLKIRYISKSIGFISTLIYFIIHQTHKIMREEFNKWIFKVCEYKANLSRNKSITAHEIYPTIDLTDAKLAFLDGETVEEYAMSI
jgi:hypothetical protein